MLPLVLCDSFLRQPIRSKETIQQPMRIKQLVGILANTRSKNKHTIGSGRDAGAFKMFVPFFRNSFYPVTKCAKPVFNIKLVATSCYQIRIEEDFTLSSSVQLLFVGGRVGWYKFMNFQFESIF